MRGSRQEKVGWLQYDALGRRFDVLRWNGARSVAFRGSSSCFEGSLS